MKPNPAGVIPPTEQQGNNPSEPMDTTPEGQEPPTEDGALPKVEGEKKEEKLPDSPAVDGVMPLVTPIAPGAEIPGGYSGNFA